MNKELEIRAANVLGFKELPDDSGLYIIPLWFHEFAVIHKIKTYNLVRNVCLSVQDMRFTKFYDWTMLGVRAVYDRSPKLPQYCLLHNTILACAAPFQITQEWVEILEAKRKPGTDEAVRLKCINCPESFKGPSNLYLNLCAKCRSRFDAWCAEEDKQNDTT